MVSVSDVLSHVQTLMTSSSQLSVSNDSPMTQGRRSAAVQFREIAR